MRHQEKERQRQSKACRRRRLKGERGDIIKAMVACVQQSVSSSSHAVCDKKNFNPNPGRTVLLDGRTVALYSSSSGNRSRISSRSRHHHPLRDITASMRLADGERGLVVVQQQDGETTTTGLAGGGGGGGGHHHRHHHHDASSLLCDVESDERGSSCVDGGGGGRFARKNFWRAAGWQSLSAPPSPTPLPMQGSGFGDIRKAFPLTPRVQPQGGGVKVRPPPLQPPRRSTDGNGMFDEGNNTQWLPPTPGGRRDIRGIIGPEMKLDLGAVQRNRDACEPTEMQLKRDKFAFFDKECSRIVEHIYLGSDAVARNRDTLRENGITHVLNCVGFVCPEYFPKELSYKTLWLQDSPSEDITSVLYDVFDYFEEVHEQGGRVFVHCCQGVSRSTSLVIAYLMWRDGRSFEDAFQDVKAARGVTNPNMGFACQLLQCQKRVHAAPVSPNSVLRMYRMAPHSPFDPLHLVPKTVTHPGVGALDSRGAFVIHVPNALYVWEGAKCDAGMVTAAQHFTLQVVRYERAQGRIVKVSEGEETIEFWDALKKGDSQGSRSSFSFHHHEAGVGKENGSPKIGRVSDSGMESGVFSPRKVLGYDKDFETYLKAKNGLPPPQVAESGLPTTHVPRDSGWSRLKKKFMSGPGGKLKQEREGSDAGALKPKDRAPAEKSLLEAQAEEGWTAGSRPLSSPDASQCSSASPFSLHSFSSHSSQSPPFMTSPCMSPPPSPSPSLSHTPSPNSSAWSPTSFHTSFPSLDALPNPLDAKQSRSSPSKVLAPSLAKRRGSVLPSLSVPNPVDEPPSTPRKSPELSSTSTKHSKERDPQAIPESGNVGCGVDALNTLRRQGGSAGCEQSAEGCGAWASSSSRPWFGHQAEEDIAESSCDRGRESLKIEARVPCLFEWPQLVKIEMFDADDLHSGAAFVLLVPDASDGRGGQLYLWVGLQRRNDQDWQHIGAELAQLLNLRRDIPVKVHSHIFP